MKNTINEVVVLTPASVANVVCGFDIMGFALNDINDRLVVRITDNPGITIVNNDIYELPTNPEHNVIGAALAALAKAMPYPVGFEVISTKMIKPGSGIGSSAASAAGAVVAANHLLNNRFSKEELVQFAMCGEEIASGARHADNIAPLIYGGFTLIRSLSPLDIVPIKFPPLSVTIIHPQIEVKTAEARALLKPDVSLKLAIAQWANVAGLVSGLINSDFDLISRSLVDHIVEPARCKLIPGYDQIKKIIADSDALGGGISGSGPSMFILSKDRTTAAEVEQASVKVFQKSGIECVTYVTTINPDGVQILN